jgi:hypothetical protein
MGTSVAAAVAGTVSTALDGVVATGAAAAADARPLPASPPARAAAGVVDAAAPAELGDSDAATPADAPAALLRAETSIPQSLKKARG